MQAQCGNRRALYGVSNGKVRIYDYMHRQIFEVLMDPSDKDNVQLFNLRYISNCLYSRVLHMVNNTNMLSFLILLKKRRGT